MTSEGDNWTKSKGRAVPGRGPSTSKDLVNARHWGYCGRGKAGGVSRVQDLQAEELSSGLIVLGSHGGFYAREGQGQEWALGSSF